jgi:hypothetical protein
MSENTQTIKKNVSGQIRFIRDQFVLLDSDLAMFFEIETKALNQAASRNNKRFPSSFRFQLNTTEFNLLKSQIVTSKGGVRKLPWAYTEHGIAMISTLIRNEMAIQMSIHIIQTFVRLRKQEYIYSGLINRIEKLETFKVETNRTLKKLILQQSNTSKKTGIFFNDQIFDAYVFSSEIISSAKKSIVLIDNYIDETTLLQLSKRKIKVSCIIYTEKLSPQLNLDLNKHNAQFPSIEIRPLKNVHDRFLIIDNKTLYHIGASLKDLGKRWFAFSQMDGILPDVMKRLE